MHRQLSWLIALLLVLPLLAACEPPPDPATNDIEAVVKAYYQAVERDDADAQATFWIASAAGEARRQAKAWSTREKQNMQIEGVHVTSIEQRQLKFVHYFVRRKVGGVPEAKAALMEDVDGKWQFRELH